MKTKKPRDRKMKTLDEERKEQAFYEATEEFLPIEMQDLIWERFLARCVCGRCGGIPTYYLTNVVQTIDGPCAHVFSPNSSSALLYPSGFSRALGSRSFHAALASTSSELYVLESASASPAFQDNNA